MNSFEMPRPTLEMREQRLFDPDAKLGHIEDLVRVERLVIALASEVCSEPTADRIAKLSAYLDELISLQEGQKSASAYFRTPVAGKMVLSALRQLPPEIYSQLESRHGLPRQNSYLKSVAQGLAGIFSR